MAKAGPDNPTGGGFSIGQFLGKLAGGASGGGGFVGGVSPMGDFDPIQFVNANLSAMQKSKDGVHGKDILQGIGQLLGVGGPPTDAVKPSTNDGDKIPVGIKPSKVHMTHSLDFLNNVLTTLGSDPNQGGK